MVAKYLSDTRVVLKNTEQNTFVSSMKVFIKEEQTPAQLVPSTDSSIQELVTYGSVMSKFLHLHEQYVINKSEQREMQLAKKRCGLIALLCTRTPLYPQVFINFFLVFG